MESMILIPVIILPGTVYQNYSSFNKNLLLPKSLFVISVFSLTGSHYHNNNYYKVLVRSVDI